MSADKPDVPSSTQGSKEKSAGTPKLEEQPVAQQPGPSVPAGPPAHVVLAEIPTRKRRPNEPQQPIPPVPIPEGQQHAASPRATEKLVQGAATPLKDVGLDLSIKKRRQSSNEPETEQQPGTSKAVDNPQLLTEDEIFADPVNVMSRLRVHILIPEYVSKPRWLQIERFTQEELDKIVVPILGATYVSDRQRIEDDVLHFKDVIGNGYLRVIGKIGSGGFGQVYAAWDCHKKNLAAIKAQTVQEDVLMEREVLLKFKDNVHSPEFHDAFKTKQQYAENQCYYVVMQLLSANLQQIRHKCKLGGPNYRLSMATAYGATLQCLAALRGLHGIGYIHRDIKPANFAIGVCSYAKLVYLYDFGLCRRYLNLDGEIIQIPERGNFGFKGTLRYASKYAHYHRELSRRDDIISLYYSFIELIRGRLPWANLKRDIDVQSAKQKFSLKDLCKEMPAEIRQFAHKIQHLLVNTEPNYDELCGLLRVCMAEVSNGIEDEYEIDYEWLHDNCTTFEHFTAAPKEMAQKTTQKTPEQEAGPAPRK